MTNYVKRWLLVEYDGNIEVREFECYSAPEPKGYIVKVGCIREFVPEDKVYETRAAAEARREELLIEAESM